jgi:hypothetical protein
MGERAFASLLRSFPADPGKARRFRRRPQRGGQVPQPCQRAGTAGRRPDTAEAISPVFAAGRVRRPSSPAAWRAWP